MVVDLDVHVHVDRRDGVEVDAGLVHDRHLAGLSPAGSSGKLSPFARARESAHAVELARLAAVSPEDHERLADLLRRLAFPA